MTNSNVDRKQRGEDLRQRFVRERIDSDSHEMPGESRRDDVSATARWTHGSEELYVFEIDARRVLSIVPETSAMVSCYR